MITDEGYQEWLKSLDDKDRGYIERKIARDEEMKNHWSNNIDWISLNELIRGLNDLVNKTVIQMDKEDNPEDF